MMITDWRQFPVRPHLDQGECQLWLACLDEEDPGDFRGLLSEDERQRAGRLRVSRSADRYTVGRGILRILVGRYLSYRPERLVFSYGPYGKPGLTAGLQEQLSFNVSHSGSLAIFAVAKGFDVGVDVEEIHPVSDLEATASIFLSPDELAELEASPISRKLERFFTLWTCKEAIMKALGSGFTGPVKDILATFCHSDQEEDAQNVIFKSKRLTVLNPIDGFKGALAFLRPFSKE